MFRCAGTMLSFLISLFLATGGISSVGWSVDAAAICLNTVLRTSSTRTLISSGPNGSLPITASAHSMGTVIDPSTSSIGNFTKQTNATSVITTLTGINYIYNGTFIFDNINNTQTDSIIGTYTGTSNQSSGLVRFNAFITGGSGKYSSAQGTAYITAINSVTNATGNNIYPENITATIIVP